MTSDDTEHTCMVAQALLVSGGDVAVFAKSLAWQLRVWLLGLPAGIGVATLRALVRLWLGFSTDRSGVFSAGNAPAMRSAIVGVCYGHDSQKLRALVRAATRITHTDPKAEFGALAVALAASLASGRANQDIPPREYYARLPGLLGEGSEEFLDLIGKVVESVAAQQTTEAFAAEMGLARGVSHSIHS